MLDKAFVIMPFSEDFGEIYSFLIKGGLSEAGYDVFRTDDLLSQQNIVNDIVKSISESQLIVADLTTANPNVYYELGLAHGLNKPVILLCQEMSEVPFDLRSYRIIPYGTHFQKMNDAKAELILFAKGALDGSVSFGSPVTDFLPAQKTKRQGDSPEGDTGHEKDEGGGLLDIQVDLDDGLNELTSLTKEIGDGLSELTPQMTDAIELLEGDQSAKEKRRFMQKIATNIDIYVTKVKLNNKRYRVVIDSVGSSLDVLLGGDYGAGEPEESVAFNTLINVLEDVGDTTLEYRKSLVGVTQTMEKIPKVEKKFDRSSRLMAAELKYSIENIDQTISVLSRARMASKGLLV